MMAAAPYAYGRPVPSPQRRGRTLLQYNTGDYWLIPARTATGDVEWPNDGGDPAATPAVPPRPLLRAPEGIAHSYCKLAAVSLDKALTVHEICPSTLPPLTDLSTRSCTK